MTNEKLQQGFKLKEEIEDVRGQITHCEIMIENDHPVRLVSGNNAFTANLAKELTQGVLRLAKDALERRLAALEKQYEEL